MRDEPGPRTSRSPRQRVEFGDFQTPAGLAHDVCARLARTGPAPAAIVEPTCGTGTLLAAALAAFPRCELAHGFELDPLHVRAARAAAPGARVQRADFFEHDWAGTLGALPEPLLVVGNPPWVTNSALGALGGANLPPKANAARAHGLEARTGQSNFDISEWMLSRLLELLGGRRAVLAMLVKTSVARRVLARAWSTDLALQSAGLFAVDARTHFGASVDACLLVCRLAPGGFSRECALHSDLGADAPHATLALRGGRVVADAQAFDAGTHLLATTPQGWRSGVKHDCAPVLELRARGDGLFENGLGQVVSLEPDHVYPLLKGSELARGARSPERFVLLPQRELGQDPAHLARSAPRTWAYLESHAARLAARASSIYRGRPRFSIFGVGAYTFAPWKVAICGFQKQLAFRCVGPVDGRPVVLDDTGYFLPCATRREARGLARGLDSPAARRLLGAQVFWDTKRPITARLLSSLDLDKLDRGDPDRDMDRGDLDA